MRSIEFSVTSNIKEIQKKLNDFAFKQMPFALSQSLTATAKKVQEAEVKNLSKVLDNPTPFTLKSIGVKGARKNDLRATVFVRDIAAAYLAPFEFGGMHKMIGPKIMNPMDAQTNAYGNLPKGTLAKLKGRKDVFIGQVKTKSGETINGVWQRPVTAAQMVTKTGKLKKLAKSVNATGHLKLLIRLDGPKEVKQHLGYRSLAQKVISATFNKEFGRALAKAMATAK